MKVTAGQLYDAFNALGQVMQRPRMLPQTGKYRIARLHDGLEPEYKRIYAEHLKLVQTHGHEVFEDEEKKLSKGWQVPQGTPGHELYTKEWEAFRAQELEVAVQPITLFSLGDDPRGVEAGEFKMLGPFVTE